MIDQTVDHIKQEAELLFYHSYIVLVLLLESYLYEESSKEI